MAARGRARRRALDILYEAEARRVDPLDVLADRRAAVDPPVHEHTVRLVEGVVAHRERIDELISTHSVDWTIDRMPAVDRNLARLAVFEVLWADDVPDEVAVSEVVRLAGELSTDSSPAFLNGLVARLVELKPTLTA